VLAKNGFNQRKNYVQCRAQRSTFLRNDFRCCRGGGLPLSLDPLSYGVVLSRVEPDSVAPRAAIYLDPFYSLRSETLFTPRTPVALPSSATGIVSRPGRGLYLCRIEQLRASVAGKPEPVALGASGKRYGIDEVVDQLGVIYRTMEHRKLLARRCPVDVPARHHHSGRRAGEIADVVARGECARLAWKQRDVVVFPEHRQSLFPTPSQNLQSNEKRDRFGWIL